MVFQFCNLMDRCSKFCFPSGKYGAILLFTFPTNQFKISCGVVIRGNVKLDESLPW